MSQINSQLISRKTANILIGYYDELNKENRVETAKQICANVCISDKTLRRFIDGVISCKDHGDANLSLYNVVMLHTAFAKSTEPYLLQQEVIANIKKQRFVKTMMNLISKKKAK